MMLQILKLLFDRLWAALACPGGVHYVSGAQSLPPPLTPEEEKQLLARMMAGDAAARDELITHNLRLVVYLAKKYESSGVPQEDMISIGTIGLIKAVNTFTPERNIKLATYASRCIGNEILMYLRKSSNRRQEASIDEPLNIDGDGNELLLSDVLGSDENQVGLRLEQDAERVWVQNFPEMWRLVLSQEEEARNDPALQAEKAEWLECMPAVHWVSRLPSRVMEQFRVGRNEYDYGLMMEADAARRLGLQRTRHVEVVCGGDYLVTIWKKDYRGSFGWDSLETLHDEIVRRSFRAVSSDVPGLRAHMQQSVSCAMLSSQSSCMTSPAVSSSMRTVSA